jgi:hypothetical protein
MTSKNRFGRRLWRAFMLNDFGWMGLAVVLCTVAASALAEDYEQLPLAQDQTGKLIRTWTMLGTTNESKAVVDMLSNNAALDNAAFDKFFNTMLFPLFTQWQDIKAGSKTYSPLIDSAAIFSPSKMRTRFKSDYASKGTNSGAHEHLNQLALAAMERIANGNFHPICRYNAMALIADLNESDPNGPPYKKALPVLLKTATAPNSIVQVRLPAMRGLERHATVGIDPESRGQVITAMLGILKQHTPPEGRDKVDHDWTTRRAIDVLSAIGEPGTGGAVVTELLAAINDGAASLPIRCAAAAALPKVKLNPQQAGNSAQLVKTLGKLAVEASKSELATAKANNSRIPVDEIKMRLDQVRQGLNSMASVADVAPTVTQLLGQIDSLVRACDTDPAKPPPPTLLNAAGGGPTIPLDTQAPIAKAIAAAGDSLENTLNGGNAASGLP